MSSIRSRLAAVRIRSGPDELRLVSWPLRDGGLPAWSAVIACLAAPIAVWWLSNSLVAGLVGLVAVVLAAWRLWLPVRYELGPSGVTVTVMGRRRRIPWRQIARYEIRRRGVVLIPDVHTTWETAVHSLYVRWNNQRDRVLTVVDSYVRQAADSERTTRHGRSTDGSRSRSS